jgi:hypothetical protein
MRHDDASWHVSEDTARETDQFAGATHIAMFLAWAGFRNLIGELHAQDFSEELEKLRSRSITPGAWFMENCDGKFTDEDLNEEGNLFAQSYYANRDTEGPAPYLLDYVDAFPEADSVYSVSDNWESFDRIAPIIDRRFGDWKKQTEKPSGLLGALGLGWLKSKKR